MTGSRNFLSRLSLSLAPLLVALLIAILLLVATGAPPFETFAKLFTGSFGTPSKQADTFVVWVSLAIVSAGLLITFTAGQWNIGVEGQIMVGSIFATWAARGMWEQSGIVGIPVIILWAMVGGALWALLVAVLKIYGKVNEIFGGLGFNFIATALNIYLIFGPWKQKTGGTLSGTEIFPEALWMPTLPELRVSPIAIIIALLVLVVIYLSLRGTLWGLQLKAIGKNIRAAFVLGVPTNPLMLSAYAVCGACAGLVGAFLVIIVHHRLIPSISSGYGFLGILIVLLSSFNALWLAPLALFFAAVSIGSTALQLELNIDSSLGGVLQGVLVLAVLLVQGVREKYFSKT
ncbi:MAG: ABC transporter permease [Chloroflexi bacterium]|nr:ABC transporter permease [Chloroflexota bacterium]